MLRFQYTFQYFQQILQILHENTDVQENQANSEKPSSGEEKVVVVTADKTANNTSGNPNATEGIPSKSSPLKTIIPIMLILILAVAIIRVLKKIRSKRKSDLPVGMKEIQESWNEDEIYPEEIYSEEDLADMSGSSAALHPEKPKTEEIIQKEEIVQKEDIIAKPDNRTQKFQFQDKYASLSNSNESSDIINQLAKNPLKPTRSSPLRQKGYTDINPEELGKEEFYNLKSSKASKPGIQSMDDLQFIAGAEIADDRGLYLIQIEEQKALIGIINSEVFVLNKFDKIKSPKFIVRKTTNDKPNNQEVYYVQVGTWCALISSDNSEMNLQTVF